jgi:hypothetical protein
MREFQHIKYTGKVTSSLLENPFGDLGFFNRPNFIRRRRASARGADVAR